MNTLSSAENTLHPSYEGGRVSNTYIRYEVLFFWGIVQPFFGNADEFVGSPGHVAAFVVAYSQDAVDPRVVQGVQVQVVLLQDRAAVGMGGRVRGHEHLGIKCDSHTLAAESQHGFNVFCLQHDPGTHLGVLENLIRYGAHTVSLFKQYKGAVLQKTDIRSGAEPFLYFLHLAGICFFQCLIRDNHENLFITDRNCFHIFRCKGQQVNHQVDVPMEQV